MRLSQAVQIIARRLGVRPGRISATASRLQHAGILPIAEGSRRFPPEVTEDQVVSLFIAAVADYGLGQVVASATAASEFRSPLGHRLFDIVFAALFREATVSHLIIRKDGASVVMDGHHITFGAPPPENGAVRGTAIAGSTVAAIAAELRGASPTQADAVAAIAKIRRRTNV